MTTHIYEPDVYTNGLNPDCPRCQELADYAEYELDSRMMKRLLAGVCFTVLDRVAMGKLLVARSEGRFTGFST